MAFSSVLLSTLTGIRSIPAYKHGIIVFGSRIAENGAGKDLQKSSHLLLGPEAKPAVLEMFIFNPLWLKLWESDLANLDTEAFI